MRRFGECRLQEAFGRRCDDGRRDRPRVAAVLLVFELREVGGRAGAATDLGPHLPVARAAHLAAGGAVQRRGRVR